MDKQLLWTFLSGFHPDKSRFWENLKGFQKYLRICVQLIVHTLIHWSIQEANHDLFEQLEMYSVKINYLQSHSQLHRARQICGGQLCLCMKCISLIIFKNKHGLQNWRGNIPEVCLFVVFACVAWALRNLNRLLKVKSGQKRFDQKTTTTTYIEPWNSPSPVPAMPLSQPRCITVFPLPAS